MTTHPYRAIVASITIVGAASAQGTAPDPETSVSAWPAPPATLRTGKERLGAKWTDEQRVNNCGVPPEKRGDTPRPDDCAPGRED